MANATARAKIARYTNYCVQGGLDPTVLLSYTCVIPSFGGGAGAAAFGQWGAAPSQANTFESIPIAWDCLVVGASVKYLNGNVPGGCDSGNGSLVINCVSAAGGIIAGAASVAGGTAHTMITLSNAEISGLHFEKSVQGLALALSSGTQLFVGSLTVTDNVDAGPVASDLSVSLQLAVPQSKFLLPTTEG